MAACTACGRANPDDARFCGTCASPLAATGSTMTWSTGGQPPPATTELPRPFEAPQGPAQFPGLPEARPVGVAGVGVWCLVAGPLFALGGLVLALAGPSVLGDPAFQEELRRQLGPELSQQVTEDLLRGFVLALGGALVLLGAGMAVVGLGLFQRKPWAWRGVLALTVGWMALCLFLLPVGLLGLAVAGLLLWYFTRPGVKAWLLAPQPAPMVGGLPPLR